jgi:hypothetical protein
MHSTNTAYQILMFSEQIRAFAKVNGTDNVLRNYSSTHIPVASSSNYLPN